MPLKKARLGLNLDAKKPEPVIISAPAYAGEHCPTFVVLGSAAQTKVFFKKSVRGITTKVINTVSDFASWDGSRAYFSALIYHGINKSGITGISQGELP